MLMVFKVFKDSTVVKFKLSTAQLIKTQLLLSGTCNELFCTCRDDVSTWRHFFSFNLQTVHTIFIIVSTHFANQMIWNHGDMNSETYSYVFRWRSYCRRCLFELPNFNLTFLKPRFEWRLLVFVRGSRSSNYMHTFKLGELLFLAILIRVVSLSFSLGWHLSWSSVRY